MENPSSQNLLVGKSFLKMPKRKSDIRSVSSKEVLVYKKVKPKKRSYRKALPEKKFFDTIRGSDNPLNITISGATYAATSALVELNAVPQGDDRDDRHGRRINMDSLAIRGLCSMTNANMSNTTRKWMQFRIICVYDKEAGGTATSTGIYQNDTAASASTQMDFYGNRQMNQPERFKVIFDEMSPILPTQQLNAISGSTGAEAAWSFQKFVPLKGLPVHYSGSTAAPTTGSLMFFFAHNLPDKDTANMTSSCIFTSRIHFSDL